MAIHETFTNNTGLAFLLGPARPDFNLGNTWFGSVSIWSGTILNPGSNSNPVVEVPVTGISGVTAIQAEVFGVRTYDGSGLASVNVTMIEWSLPGSATVLARYTFDNPVVFPISISRFVNDWRFVDILNEIIVAGFSPQDLFDDYFQNADTLIGGDAADILYGGGGNDVIDGGGAADRLRGDGGSDTFVYRSIDAVSNESVDGGNGIDRILAIGAAANGDIRQTGGVDLRALSLSSVEELHLNGTEAVVTVNQLGTGLSTFVGRTGFRDQLTITDVANGSIGSLGFVNWDLAQDTVAIVGTGASDNVEGSLGQDIFLGLGGTDFFNGQSGDDRFLILSEDFNPSDNFFGDAGNDVLQVDSTAIQTLPMTPLTNLRNLVLTSIEVLDIVKGSFTLDGSDFAGAVTGTLAAPVPVTGGFNRIIGNGNDSAANLVLLEINLSGLLAFDMRTTVFENWNDGFFADKTIRIVAGAQTRIIYAPNEETFINATGATQGVFFFGGGQFDQFFGSSAIDFIQSEGGDDFIVAFNGNDIVDGGEGDDQVQGGIGNDILGGAGGRDTLYGETGTDTLTGGQGNDSLYGGEDGDLLMGGAGADLIDGGGSTFDLVSYQLATAGVLVDLDAAGSNTGEAAGDTLLGIEGIIGSAHADTLRANGQDNGLYGQAGNDTLMGRGGADIVLGGADADVIYGGLGNDTLGGEGGDDLLYDESGNDTLDGGTGNDTVVMGGARAAFAFAGTSANLTATGAGNTDSLLSVEFVQFDDGLFTVAQLATTTNLPPVITSNGSGANAAIFVAENTTAVTTVTSTDPDAGATRTYSLVAGGDAARFAINATTGALAFVSAPNFETPVDVGTNNVYNLTVRVSDGALTDEQAIAVTVTNANEAPVITSNGGAAAAAISVAENRTGVTTVTSTDPDAGATRTYSISGGADAARFVINATTGALAFVSAPNFEAPVDVGANNVYNVIVRASDGALTDTQALAVTVTNSTVGVTITGTNGNDTTSPTQTVAGQRLATEENDLIQGLGGNDNLNGGLGNDNLTGGLGTDTFVFNTTLGASNIDRITDFNVIGETMRLENTGIFTGLVGGTLAAAAFVRNTSGNAADASDRIIYETDTGRLFFDRDGTGGAAKVQFATLNTNLAINNADFFVF